MVIVDRRATIVFFREQRSKKAGFPAKEIRMADKSARLPDNVKGKWYVDASCTGCGLCTSTAPDIFALNNEGQAIVVRQPETAEETSLAVQAQEECPVQAIGDDGE